MFCELLLVPAVEEGVDFGEEHADAVPELGPFRRHCPRLRLQIHVLSQLYQQHREANRRKTPHTLQSVENGRLRLIYSCGGGSQAYIYASKGIEVIDFLDHGNELNDIHRNRRACDL